MALSARATPHTLALSLELYTAAFGWSIAAQRGAGEGERSIAISAPYALANQSRRGLVYTLSREALLTALNTQGESPLPTSPTEGVNDELVAPWALEARFESPHVAWGELTQERLTIDAIYSTPNSPYDSADRFGASLAWAPAPLAHPSQPQTLAISAPRRAIGDSSKAGEVTLWRDEGGRLRRVGRVVGQTQRPGAQFGVSLEGGHLAGRSTLLVGAPYANAGTQANAVEAGGVLLIDLEEQP